MKNSVFTLMLFFLSACSGGSRPDWIEGETNNYPQAQYLTASGSATDPETAGTRALGNLAKIFEVRIDETSRDESSAWRKTGDEEMKQGTSQLTARYIDASTTKLLEGARIVESWVDENQDRHYALAAISRSQLSIKLREQINQADRYISKRLSQARGLSDPLLRAQKLYSTRTAFATRAQAQRDLQIVDRTGAGLPAKWTWKDIAVRIDRELAKMTVAETVLPSPSSESVTSVELDKLLQTAVTATGMQYVQTAAAYKLQGSLELQDIGLQDGWYWHRGALQVDLLENAGNKVMASARFPLKSSGQTQQQSLVRMQDEIARLLNNELKHALLAFGGEEKNIQQ